MIFFWPKVYGPLGKTPYIYHRYQVWGGMDLGFDFALYHPQKGQLILLMLPFFSKTLIFYILRNFCDQSFGILVEAHFVGKKTFLVIKQEERHSERQFVDSC